MLGKIVIDYTLAEEIMRKLMVGMKVGQDPYRSRGNKVG